MVRRFFVLTLVAALAALAATMPGSAQPRQNGLVNLNLSNNSVLIPIGIAANVCGLKVAAIAAVISEPGGSVKCDAEALSTATITDNDGNGGADARQTGLINVNIEDNDIIVPIAAAANICDVDLALLLAAILNTPPGSTTECEARAESEGIITRPA